MPWPPAPQPYSPPLPTQLLVEGRASPPDIDNPQPLLSWTLSSTRPGDGVSAWQVQLNSSTALLWDSGRVNGSAYSVIAQPPVPLTSGQVLSWSVRLWDLNGAPTVWAQPSTFSTAKLGGAGDFSGVWIGADPALLLPLAGAYGPGHPAVYLRSPPLLLPPPATRTISRATAYFSGLGYGKLLVNGALAHATLELSPGFTTYEFRTQYNVLDVTAAVQAAAAAAGGGSGGGGTLTLAAILGDGWYSLAKDSSCCASFQHQHYVNSTRMLLDVEVEFVDGGERLTLASNASWQWALGEITSTHFNGESVDKRWALPPSWATSSGKAGTATTDATTDTTPAAAAADVPSPWGVWRAVTLLDGPPAIFPGSILTSQKEPPTLAGGLVLQPQTVRHAPAPNGSSGEVIIYDFGREIQGRPVITARATTTPPPGQAPLQLRTLVCGSFYLTRAFTCDEFTQPSLNNGNGPGLYNFTLGGVGGALETYRPLFTYSALRRLVVHVPPGVTVVGVEAEQVVMEQPPTGTLLTSHPTYNWLHAALARTQVNYCTGVPNDPSRERVGYTQDMQNMFRGAAFEFGPSSQTMYARWMDDMVDGQAYSVAHPGTGIPAGPGQMPTVIPGPKSDQANSVFWGGMVVWLPWRHFLHYGDVRVLQRMYAPMMAYARYLNASASGGELKWGLADWNSPLPQCSGWGDENATSAINTPGLYLVARIIAAVATFLGGPHAQEDAAAFSALGDTVAAVYNAAFLDPSTGRYATGQQCNQAQALAMEGLVPPAARPAVVAAYLERVAWDNTALTVGFVSFLHAVLALAQAEQPGVLHALVTRRNYGPEGEGTPGFCSNSDGPGGRNSTLGGCAPGPHSNSVGAWPSSDLMKESWQGDDAIMPSLTGPLLVHSYHVLAGVRTAETLEGAGFANFSIFPSPVGGLLWLNASVASRLGEIRVAWVVQAGVGGGDGGGGVESRHFFLSVRIPPGATATVGVPCNTTTPGGIVGPERTLVVVGAGEHFFDCQLTAPVWLNK